MVGVEGYFSLDHTQGHHTVGRTSQRPFPDNTQHLEQTSMPPAGFERANRAGDRLQTPAIDRLATGMGVRTIK